MASISLLSRRRVLLGARCAISAHKAVPVVSVGRCFSTGTTNLEAEVASKRIEVDAHSVHDTRDYVQAIPPVDLSAVATKHAELISYLVQTFAAKQRVPLSQLRRAQDFAEPADEKEAFAVQRLVVREIKANHPHMYHVGYKLGATSDTVQKKLGIKDPFVGPLFANRMYRAPFAAAPGFLEEEPIRGIECEVAFATALPHYAGALYSPPQVVEGLGHMCPVLELAGSRFHPDSGPLSVLMTIADLGGFGRLIMGKKASVSYERVDFPKMRVALDRNGVQAAQGTGAEVMGHPFSALAHGINFLTLHGYNIPRGVLFSTGTMTGITPVAPGDKFLADFEHLGIVKAYF